MELFIFLVTKSICLICIAVIFKESFAGVSKKIILFMKNRYMGYSAKIKSVLKKLNDLKGIDYLTQRMAARVNSKLNTSTRIK